MKASDSNLEDSSIYNSLPVELFTNEFEDDLELEDDFDSDDKDFPADEVITDFRDLTRSQSPEIPVEEVVNLHLSGELIREEEPALPSAAAIQEPVIPPSRASSHSLPPASGNSNEDSGLWIRCTRCGKKNDLDCNFCGKCGLQIHKVISIAEAESDAETTNPEVVRNIKYHYKRPVFCFGPRGNCFASFSSPSKSVRNVVKFRLSTLAQFKAFMETQMAEQVTTGDYDKLWTEEGFKNAKWSLKEGFLRSLSVILTGQSGFSLDESLRVRLLDFFASISPKDLGSIKNLAVQDTVRYSRADIDEIFHKLVLGQIREACEECIAFNYWDHALIIAKTLDHVFYESVMNRFLNARFANGHPLRTLYLIMTSNEQAALEQIRAIIGDEGTVSFVKDIWAVLCNFLLRAKPGVSNICSVFEDIGNCLFDQKLFENALICYTIAVLTGASFGKEAAIVNRIDFLLAHFLRHPEHETIDFAGMRVVYLLTEKLSIMHPNTILWRCQFVKLMFTQYLYDMDSFDQTALITLTQARQVGKTAVGYPKLLAEEATILCARQVIDEALTLKQEQPQFKNTFIPPAAQVKSPVMLPNPQPYSLPSPSFVPSGGYEPAQHIDLAPAPPVVNDSFTPSASASSPVNDFSMPNSDASRRESNTTSQPAPLDKDQGRTQERERKPSASSKQPAEGDGIFSKWKMWVKNDNAKNDPQKQVVVAKMGQKNTLRYDEKLKKWVDDSDPSTFEPAPKIAPPPVSKTSMVAAAPTPGPSQSLGPNSASSIPATANNVSFRAKKGKLKYFDPLNPDADAAAPTIPSFSDL